MGYCENPEENREECGSDTGEISWKRKPLSSQTQDKQFLKQKFKSCILADFLLIEMKH